jgi:hypothetical protein
MAVCLDVNETAGKAAGQDIASVAAGLKET